jgi:predicted transcriptional regulator
VRQFGDLEAVVMDRLWAWDYPATVREVLDDLLQDRKLAYTTVMTVMDNLRRKGVLTREVDGRAYRYTPTHSRADYSAELIAGVLAKDEDRAAPLLRFVEQMTPEEVTRLWVALDDLESAAADKKGPARARRGSRQ